MKILHITYIYPPKLDVADGITAVAYNVTKELVKRGHEVAVYTSDMLNLHGNKSLCSGHSIINGVDVYYSRSTWRSKTFIITPGIFPLLLKNVTRYDVIHIHDCRSFQGIAAYLLARLKKIPYVFHSHGSFLSPLPQSANGKITRISLDQLISEKIVRNASKIIVLHAVEVEQYKAIGVPEEEIAIIPNGIDLSKCNVLPPKGGFKSKYRIGENKRTILCLGRVHETKGIDFLIKAFALLVRNGFDDTVLIIAGPDDGYANKAQQLMKSLEISERAIFTGLLSEMEKINAYIDADVVVNVEPRNVFGLVPLEAAACSTPVVVSKGNAISDIITQGKFGFSVKYGDTNELAGIIGNMLNNDNLRMDMGQKGRKFVFENHNWTNIVSGLENVYKEIMY